MKKCPFCAEEIQDDAIKCRFCGEFLKKKKWKSCLFGCLVTFFASILLIILFIYLSFLVFKFIVYKIFFVGPNLPYYYPPSPFNGEGIAGVLKEFAEVMRRVWEGLMDFLRFSPPSHRISF